MVVIGKKASYVEEAEAMDYVADIAFTMTRKRLLFQPERGGQW
jgi:2-keto-4-pentenoate hydratase/2-oxohepta-3-ene-1,7-dioic acid hydratase in catechol pathway